MAFQFPANPTLGQQYAPAQGTTYEWNGTGWILLGLTVASLYPAGIIMPYAGSAPLPFQGWLLCDGASYATTAQPALFAIIGYSYGGGGGNFSVPDLRGRVIAGVDTAGRLTNVIPPTLGAAGGQDQVYISAAQMPAHSHGITDVAHSHGVSDPSHAHGVYDPGHNHSLNDPTHNHGISDGGHSHGYNDPGHEHRYDRARDQGNQKPASSGTAPFDTYESNSRTDGAGIGITIQSSGANIGINGAYTGVSVNAAGTSIGIYGAGTGIGIYNSGTGISGTHNAGSNGAHLNVQPTICLNYIIKA